MSQGKGRNTGLTQKEMVHQLYIDMKAVREQDIPSLREAMATVKAESANNARKTSIFVGGIGVMVSAFVAWLKGH